MRALLKMRLFILILFLGCFAYAEQKYSVQKLELLSYEEFLSLTKAEKKDYIREIQKLVTDLTTDAPVSFWQSFFFQEAVAQSSVLEGSQKFNFKSDNKNEELERLDSLMRTTRKFKQATLEHNDVPTVRQLVPYNAQSIVQRMNQVRPLLTRDFEIKAYNQILNEFRNDFPQQAAQIQAIDSARVKKSSANAAREMAQKKEKPDSVKTAKEKTEAVTPLPKDYNPSCIYAGFVIPGGKCQPHKSLPENMKLDEITTWPFECEGQDQILCNPLLYGYTTACSKPEPGIVETCKQVPLCIRRSRTATKECTKLANTKELNEQIFKIWNNPKNKKIYSEFVGELTSLCYGTAKARKPDVEKTCKVAVERYNSVRRINFPSNQAPTSSSEASVQKPSGSPEPAQSSGQK